eukprot:c20153_g1_i1 orf=636-1229(+)
MHHPPGSIKVDALIENGMVAPGVPLSLMHQEDVHTSVPENSLPSKASKVQYIPDATAMATTDAYPEKEENGTHLDGHTHGFPKHGDTSNTIEEPKTEMEGFIMREDDIDVIQEPVAEIDSFVKGAHDDYEDLQQPLMSSDRAAGANESFVPQKRRVQWNDNYGKELVHVHEYEASDTGDSEEDEDDADAHACTCTIQ